MLSRIRPAIERNELVSEASDSALDGGLVDSILVLRLLRQWAKSCSVNSGSWRRYLLDV